MNVLRCTTCSKILGSREGPFVCHACGDAAGDRSEAEYFDELDAAARSEVQGHVCTWCASLTTNPYGVCDYCRDSWGESERNHPSNPRWVPNRDTNWGQPV